MTGVDVDTRSDIYSLGVLLYELLTGVTPFDPKELTKSGLDEMRRIIREMDPERPSARLTRTGGTVRKLVSSESQIANHKPKIDPDLDWIIIKCLEKDRARRYSTAQELAVDLQRYLDLEPVLARPPSAGYRLRKAIRRHRGAFAAAAAILLTVLAGAGLSFWQAVRATRAEHAADRSRNREVALRQKAEKERERALVNQRRAEINEYIADINLAHQSIQAGNLSRAIDLLDKHQDPVPTHDPRGFEWRYLWKLAQGDEHSLFATESSSVLALAVNSTLLPSVCATPLKSMIWLASSRTPCPRADSRSRFQSPGRSPVLVRTPFAFGKHPIGARREPCLTTPRRSPFHGIEISLPQTRGLGFVFSTASTAMPPRSSPELRHPLLSARTASFWSRMGGKASTFGMRPGASDCGSCKTRLTF